MSIREVNSWNGRRFRLDILIYGSGDLIGALFVNLQGQTGNGNRLLE